MESSTTLHFLSSPIVYSFEKRAYYVQTEISIPLLLQTPLLLNLYIPIRNNC